MAMNLCHRVFCSSHRYFKSVEDSLLPWALADVDLGDNVLEIGPGYGANIRVLIDRAPHYSAVEIDQVMAARLQDAYGDRARIIRGDGTDTGLPAGEFSSVVCFTMLHHIPTAELQDRLFAEVFRVLRRGGVFAGSDSASSIPFRVLHFRDICNPVSLESLPNRLRANGFSDVYVGAGRGSLRWRAVKK
jgi:SAM-dependent methyltransferase